jgi:cytochrome c2
MGCRFLILLVLGWAAIHAAEMAPGDSGRGKTLFVDLQCGECHRVSGEGQGTASDLGKIVGRGHTSAALAATLWNHAPAMWTAMESRGASKPLVTPAQASDLFAFFHASGYFESPGDAGRGKRVFERKGCAGCHALSQGAESVGPPVDQWGALASTIALAAEMWNHSPAMAEVMRSRGIETWPQFSQQELTDLLIYLRHVPGQRGEMVEFSLSNVEGGRQLLADKGCAGCHGGAVGYGGSHTVTSFAAAMWNHSAEMRRKAEPATLAPLSNEEMEAILVALWFDHLYAETGNSRSGQKVFRDKGCAACHEPDSLTGADKPLHAFGIVSALWRHGPDMKARMETKGVKWPRFSESEMANLIAFLNAVD